MGNQPELDPAFTAKCCRLQDEINYIKLAIKWHEAYFPRRESERAILHRQLSFSQKTLTRYMDKKRCS